MTDITVLDKVAITTLCLFMVLIGLYPSFMVPMVETGVENILRLLGGANVHLNIICLHSS